MENLLSVVPTAVIFSDLTNTELLLHIHVWGVMGGKMSLSSSFEWDEEYEKLLAEGKSEKIALREIQNVIVQTHKLLSGFLTDVYFLQVNPLHEPQLFLIDKADYPAELTGQLLGQLRQLQQEKRAEYEKLLREKAQGKIELMPSNSKAPSGLEVFIFETPKIDSSGYIVKWEKGQASQEIIKLPNNVILEMVYIPAGEFLMGVAKNEAEADSSEYSHDSEYPQHKVKVPAFYMAKHPITQEQYQAVMGKNPSNFEGSKHPVEQVTWDEAKTFCQKLSVLTKVTYRLPTEAQWEYACRGGTQTPFYFGETISTEVANYDGDYSYANAAKGEYRDETTEVDSFPPNMFGLYDMHGNVNEWCEDVWHENYDGAPNNAMAWVNGGEQESRVIRGGAYYDTPNLLRSAFRNGNDRDTNNQGLGFRLCRM